jgi:hypothetical protein
MMVGLFCLGVIFDDEKNEIGVLEFDIFLKMVRMEDFMSMRTDLLKGDEFLMKYIRKYL